MNREAFEDFQGVMHMLTCLDKTVQYLHESMLGAQLVHKLENTERSKEQERYFTKEYIKACTTREDFRVRYGI